VHYMPCLSHPLWFDYPKKYLVKSTNYGSLFIINSSYTTIFIRQIMKLLHYAIFSSHLSYHLSSLLGPNILLSTLFSDTLNVFLP
jgi:hypothetical protein